MTIRAGGVILLLATACVQPVMEQQRVLTWLDAKTAAPDMDVSGTWESPMNYWEGGWGSGTLVQRGAQVTGTLGLYSLEGRVVKPI